MDTRSRKLRHDILAMLGHARRGHLASALSLVEMLRILYDEVLRLRPDDPAWPDRDRLILSKGHGCLALYALLADKGLIGDAECRGFCRFDGILGGHPVWGKIPGVEATTGSLGHGLSIGVGLALAARCAGSPARVFVILGDGECGEGSVWEAALSAAKHKLENLVAIVDYNKQQSYGPVAEVLALEPFADKWRAFGFDVLEADGHDLDALRRTFAALPRRPGRPTAVICHTVKGKGIGPVEGNLAWHHKSNLTDADLAALGEALDRCAGRED